MDHLDPTGLLETIMQRAGALMGTPRAYARPLSADAITELLGRIEAAPATMAVGAEPRCGGRAQVRSTAARPPRRRPGAA